MQSARDSLVGTQAPELLGTEWFNSRPLSLAELRADGQSVLLDFWTYSCINCLRTLPALTSWWERYRHQGLMIIGVHSPEFAFEKVPANVGRAMHDLGISWPVLNDRMHDTWNAYANHYWPRHILIDTNGTIIHDHIGQGDYEDTELAIQQLLTKHGATHLPPVTPTAHKHKLGEACYASNPETYLGSLRGALKNGRDERQSTGRYNDPDNQQPGAALQGSWRIEDESIVHTGTGQPEHEYLSLVFSGLEVNVVAGSTNERTIELLVLLNGRPVPHDQQGSDIIERSGHTIVRIQEPRMYRLIKSKTYLSPAELRLADDSGRFQAYAFTFSGCQED